MPVVLFLHPITTLNPTTEVEFGHFWLDQAQSPQGDRSIISLAPRDSSFYPETWPEFFQLQLCPSALLPHFRPRHFGPQGPNS